MHLIKGTAKPIEVETIDDKRLNLLTSMGYVQHEEIPQEYLDLVSEQEALALEEVEKQEAKADKLSKLDALTVEVNGVKYDANQEAINNMSSVVGIAHAKYNQLSGGIEAYGIVYKQTIEWKGADNSVHTVQIESIVEALEAAMNARALIYGAVHE